MQEFFLKHKKRIIGAGIAILVLVTVIASCIKLNATLLESAIGVVVTPFQDLTTGISSWIDDTVTSARNKTKLKDENEELKQQIAELTNKNRKLSMYETENERLTALLKIAQKYIKTIFYFPYLPNSFVPLLYSSLIIHHRKLHQSEFQILHAPPRPAPLCR